MRKRKILVKTVNGVTKSFTKQKSLEDSLKQFEEVFKGDDSFRVRHFASVSKDKTIKFCLLYLNGMVDPDILDKSIINPIIRAEFSDDFMTSADVIISQVITNHSTKKSRDSQELLSAIVQGDSVLCWIIQLMQ